MSCRHQFKATHSTEPPSTQNSQNTQKSSETSNCADIADSARKVSEEEHSKLLEVLAEACKDLDIKPAEITAELSAEAIADWCSGELSVDTLVAFARSLVQRREMAQGKRPSHYTACAQCQYCGPIYVPMMHGGAVLTTCPWCRNREAGFTKKKDGRLIEASPIPRPKKVCCAHCKHWAADVFGNGTGIGTCARGGPISTDEPAYPNARRRCSAFTQKAGRPSES